METAIVRWGFIGILENEMETAHPKRCKISSVHGPWYGLAGSTLKPSIYDCPCVGCSVGPYFIHEL